MSSRDQATETEEDRGRAVERLKAAVAQRSRPPAPSPERIQELKADARYHRERLALYQGKVYGARPTTAARLRELQQASDRSAQRLRHALRDLAASDEARSGASTRSE